MKLKKLLTVVLSLSLSIGMLAGCSGGSDAPSDSGAIDEEQYINTYIFAEPTTFDSAIATDTYAINILNNVMEPLYRLIENPDGSIVPTPAGAESFDTNEDQTVWTFHLRDNTWSDGKPVTAYDYEYGIKKVLDPEVGAAYSYILMPIKNSMAVNWGEMPLEDLGVKALDDKTLEITLEQPTSYFMDLLYHSTMFPQRQDIDEQYGDQYGTDADKVVCNGPFVLDSWVHNSELVLKKNENYWDKDSVKLETVTYKIIQDENAIYNSFENGSIDMADTSTKEWTEIFKQNEELTYTETDNAKVYYQYYNQNDKLFSNDKVRKAFTIAIDREALVEAVYDGRNTPAYAFVPPMVNVGSTEFRSAAGDPIKKLIDENPDPKALLIEGLKELGMDPDPSKITVEMQLGGTDQWTKMLGEYMQQIYKEKLGIKLEIKMLDWGVFMTNYYNLDYQIAQMAFGADFNDPLSLLSCIESTQDGFCIGYGDKRIDELIYAATEETDEQKKIEMIAEIEDIFMYRDCCVAPIVYTRSDSFCYNYVKNLVYSPFATNGYKYVYTQGRK